MIEAVKTISKRYFVRLKDIKFSLADYFVFVSVMFYTILFSFLSVEKHNNFITYAWDLGIFNQALWTTVNYGRLLYNTVEQFIVPSGSFFGIHFSPILFIILPVYALFPSPETLLVIQSLVLGLAAIPLYLIAKEEFKDNLAGALIAMAYLMYPALHGVNYFDFHVQSFLPLFFFMAVYFQRRGKWARFFLFITLSLMVIEHVSLIVIFMGLYYLAVQRNDIINLIKERRKALISIRTITPFALIALGMTWYTMQSLIKATFFPVDPAMLLEYKAVRAWSVLGVTDDPMSMPLYVLLNPHKALEALTYDLHFKLAYLILLFGPLLFIPLRSSFLIISFVWLIPALLSNAREHYLIGNQYPAFIIPFIFIAMIYALSHVQINSNKKLKYTLVNVLIASLLFSAFSSPFSPIAQAFVQEVPIIFSPQPVLLREGDHVQILKNFIKLIPSNASILTQNNIFPHVSNRINAYVIPLQKTFSVKPDKLEPYIEEILNKTEYILIDMYKPYCDPMNSWLLKKMSKENLFGLYAYDDDILLFKRGYQDRPVIFLLHKLYNYRSLNLYSGTVVEDPSSKSREVFLHTVKDESGVTFWFGPYDFLPPGSYEAKFRLKVNRIGYGHVLTLDVAIDGGKKILSCLDIDLSNFTSANTWQVFTLEFTLEKFEFDIEFRGMYVSDITNICLDYVEVVGGDT